MSEESKLKTRDQRYAAAIYEQVVRIEPKKEEEWVKDYGRLANNLPVLVKRAGLAQALSFAAKDEEKKKGNRQLLDDLQEVVLKISGRNDLNVRHKSLTAELSEYLWLTQQVMTALHWYKRFAQSVLDIEQGDEGGRDDKG
jgi:CRISPR-associated protein Cmr5